MSAALSKSFRHVFRNIYGDSRLKFELLRLLAALLWFGFGSLVMVLVQINGDALHAKYIRKDFLLALAAVKKANFNVLYDFSFQHLPQLSTKSIFNPDLMLHSYIIVSLIAGAVHWPFFTFIHRLRRFFWLYGLGYLLRAFTLASTVLPPSNPLCIPQERSFGEMLVLAPKLIFGYAHTCTDKLFSGHTTVATLLLWFWIDARSLANDRAFSFWKLYSLFHFSLMILSSIMGWNHYTVDIVLALIVNTLSFWCFKLLIVLIQTRSIASESEFDIDDVKSIPNTLLDVVAWCDGSDIPRPTDFIYSDHRIDQII